MVLSLLFLISVLTIFGWMHYFVYRRISGGLAWNTFRCRMLLGVLVTAGGLFLAAMFLRRSAAWAGFFLTAVHWLGILSIFVSAFFLERLCSLVWDKKRKIFTLAALGLASTVSLLSLWNGTRDPILREVRVPIRNLQDSLQGFTLVQLSDLHLGHSMSVAQWERTVRRVLDLKADLIVITGDILDREVCETEPGYCLGLKALQAPQGVLAVPGNHDYYAGFPYVAGVLRAAGIRLLINEWVGLAGGLQVAGVDDTEGWNHNTRGPDLAWALRGTDAEKPLLLLMHRPSRLSSDLRSVVDLQLSGHTHGGQIPPLDLLNWLLFPYWHGLYSENGTYIYTSCGTSTWGPRMRFLTRSEIVLLRLVRSLESESRIQ